jgi:hypothetical protein
LELGEIDSLGTAFSNQPFVSGIGDVNDDAWLGRSGGMAAA